jgi:predicted phage tail protein
MERFLGCVVLALVLAVGDAHAATRVLDAPMSVPRGSAAIFRVEAPDRAKACTLTASRGAARQGAFVYRVARPIVSFVWRVPRRARPGAWTVRVRCAATRRRLSKSRPATGTIRVRGARTNRGVKRLILPASLRVRSEPRDGYTGLLGGKGGVDCSPGVLDRKSTYCTGYCTWYAWSRRPEAELKGLGDASSWLPRARSRGIPTGTSPVVGAIAWWDERVADGFGHVGFVESVSPDGRVTVAEMNRQGWNIVSRETYGPGERGRPHGYIYGGSAGDGTSSQGGGPPSLTPSARYQMGFRGVDGAHWSIGAADSRQLPYGVQSGTSPAISALAGGGYQMAFHGSDGALWSVGSAESRKLPYGVKADTSPAITGLAGGGYQIAFHGADGALWSVGSADSRKLPYGVKADTSPAITALSSGGYQIAFHGSDGALWSVGSAESRKLPYGLKSGTDPAITGLAGGGYQIAFQGSDGALWTVGSADSRKLPYGVKADTSPAITALSSGGYQIAFHGADGALWSVGTAESRQLPYGLRDQTSPAISGLAGGGYQIAFQGGDGALWSVGTAESRRFDYGMPAGTSPTISSCGC